MSNASENKQPSEEEHGKKNVRFEHVNSLNEVKVVAEEHDTLTTLWESAYHELKEPHRPDDRLQTEDGTDLMPHLGLTLAQLRDQQGVKSRKFEIIGPTGGAEE